MQRSTIAPPKTDAEAHEKPRSAPPPRPGLLGTAPPRRLGRWVARLPILLYRLGLGGLLGGRFLLLTHRGRKSGQVRRTILEVVAHDPVSGAYIVASGWGAQADWFRNIQQTPRVGVTVGGRRFPAVARRLSAAAAGPVLADYARRHPLAFRALVPVLLGQSGHPADAQALAQAVPLVALVPRPARTAR
jgi:deazaflavin-dependent oxidoreductase (nitroreductase family)